MSADRAGRRNRKFTPVAETLAEFLAHSGMAERIDQATIVPEWAERVGPAIARVTRPLVVTRGALVVAVRSSAWLMELNLVEREIVKRLNADRERGRIQRIRWVLDGDAPGERRRRGRPGNANGRGDSG